MHIPYTAIKLVLYYQLMPGTRYLLSEPTRFVILTSFLYNMITDRTGNNGVIWILELFNIHPRSRGINEVRISATKTIITFTGLLSLMRII